MNSTPNDPTNAKSPAALTTGLSKAEVKSDKPDQNKKTAEGQSLEAQLWEREDRINANLKAAGFGKLTLQRPSIGRPLRKQYLDAKENLQWNKWALEAKEFSSEDALLNAYADFDKQVEKVAELYRRYREAGV